MLTESEIQKYRELTTNSSFEEFLIKAKLNPANDFDKIKEIGLALNCGVTGYKGKDGHIMIEMWGGDGNSFYEGKHYFDGKGKAITANEFKPNEMYQIGLIKTDKDKDNTFDYRGSGSSWHDDMPGPSKERILELIKDIKGVTPQNVDKFRFLYTESGDKIAIYYVGDKEEASKHAIGGFQPKLSNKIDSQLEGLQTNQNGNSAAIGTKPVNLAIAEDIAKGNSLA